MQIFLVINFLSKVDYNSFQNDTFAKPYQPF